MDHSPTSTPSTPIPHGLSRRTLLGAATTTGLTLALGLQRSSADTRVPMFQEVLAQLPAGDQLAWFIAAVNDGGTTLTEADVIAHVAPTFLAAIPSAQIIGLIQGIATGYGALTLQGLTRPPTATQAVALVATTVGTQLALPITVESDAPHRITGLSVYPSPSSDGTPLLPITKSSKAATLIDVGGRGLYQEALGSGGPTVIFDAGLGDSAATWSGIIPAIAALTRVVSYDRPNTIAGASDPVTMPRTADDVVTDVHSLLKEAAVPGPYVLVGHSIGGLFTRLYASRYPDQVAGLVLIDASHEEQGVRRQGMVGPALFAVEQQAVSANPEGIDLNASFDQMRASRTSTPLHPMPLIVLSAGQADPAMFPAGWPMAAETQLHDELQADLAGLVPGGRHVVAKTSGHYIQQSQPDLVVAAIRDVVQAVRDPSSWAIPTS